MNKQIKKILSENKQLNEDVEKLLRDRMNEKNIAAQTSSSIFRELSLSGVAVAWMFRKNTTNELFSASIVVFVLALAIDLYYNYKRMLMFEKNTDESCCYNDDVPDNPNDVYDIVKPLSSDKMSFATKVWRSRFILMIVGYFIIVLPILCNLCNCAK